MQRNILIFLFFAFVSWRVHPSVEHKKSTDNYFAVAYYVSFSADEIRHMHWIGHVFHLQSHRMWRPLAYPLFVGVDGTVR